MIALLLIGVIVLAVGYYAPLPPPLPVILQIVGVVLVLWALVLLVLFLASGTVAVP